MARYVAVLNGRVVGVLDASTPPTTHIPLGMSFCLTEHLPEVTVGWFYADGVFTEASVTQKEQFIVSMQAHLTKLAQVVQQSQALVAAFVDRGYDPAASDPITDADLAPFGVIVYDMGAAINLLQSLTTLAAVPVNEATISKWREL